MPSLVRRARGFDVPDFLAAGPRDVLVPAAGVAAARQVLLQSEIISEDGRDNGIDPPWRLFAGVVGAFAVVAGVAWLASVVLT